MTRTRSWSEIPNILITWVTPVLVLGLTISIMWQGYKIVRGAGGQDHLLDVFFGSLRAFLVFSLCLASGAYSSTVMTVAYELREGLTSLFTSSDASVYAQLDKTLASTSTAFKKILDFGLDHINIGFSSTDMSGLVFIAGGSVMACAIWLYTFVAAIEMVIIDVSLAILLAVGPLFIAALAFTSTAQFFNTWMGSLLKYIFTAMAIAAVVGLGLNIIQEFATRLTETAPETIDYVGMALGAAMSIGMLLILTKKGAQIGADLSGGIALQIASLAQAARWAVNPAGAAASAAGKVAGAGAGHVAGRTAGAVAKTAAGQAIGGSPAMRAAMTGVNSMSHMAGGARHAMSHRSVVSAMRAGFQSGSSASHGRGTITK